MSFSFLCMSEDFKGVSFLKTLKQAGHRVFLLTDEKERNSPWPREAIDELFLSPRNDAQPHDRQKLVDGTAWLAREHGIDCIVALDDFDVEDAALLREEFRIPGMGQTTARYFRDKLAMRMRAKEAGIPVPAFTPLFRLEEVREFCASNPGPYVIKPRGEASASGITKVANIEEAIATLNGLGDQAYRYLMECFAPGRVYHVDAIVSDGEFQFIRSSVYADPPLAVVQGGGMFQTRLLDPDSDECAELKALTGDVMRAFGMKTSASHTEFIRDADGRFLFLETSSRVGGAYIANMIHRATGVDLWSEWAKLEISKLSKTPYRPVKAQQGYGGVSIKAVGEKHPQVEGFDSTCVAEEIEKDYHVGRVFAAKTFEEVKHAQDSFASILTAKYAG